MGRSTRGHQGVERHKGFGIGQPPKSEFWEIVKADVMAILEEFRREN